MFIIVKSSKAISIWMRGIFYLGIQVVEERSSLLTCKDVTNWQPY
jgi:hypothetical protein